jgi:hypothetical protein
VSVPLWVIELAAEFWKRAGDPGPLPRNLRRAAHRGTPLSVKELPRLTVRAVSAWLHGQGVSCVVGERDRALRACLFARESWCFVFLDADDTEAEQRFSLGHELAHYLRHYWQPRQRAVANFGPGILDIFDGKRLPTPAERLHAVLRNIHVGAHVHLLMRDDGRGGAPSVEVDADRLGCELLAPAAAVRSHIKGRTTRALRLEAESCLETVFGLPRAVAAWYAAQLYPPVDDPLLRRLGIIS